MSRRHILPALLLVLSLANIVVSYLAGHAFREYLIENSDLLYLPTLFSDLFVKGGSLSDWFLTPAPYFFPDFPVYLIAHLLGPDTYHRLVMFSVAQALLVFAAIWLLVRRVSPSDAITAAVMITVALVWLALSAGEPFVILLASATHYGAYISAVVLVALWIQCSASGSSRIKRALLTGICALVFLATLSDNFFIVQAMVPFVATAILAELADRRFLSQRGWLLFAGWVLLALVVPALTYRIPIPAPVINVAWSAGIDDQQRRVLESEFRLIDGDARGGQLWTYRIADTSRANVGALVESPAVEDTQHIDRRSFAVDGTESRLWRAVSTLPIGFGVSGFVVLGLAFVGRTLSELRAGLPVKSRLIILLPVLFSALGSISYGFVVANPTRYPPSLGLEKAYGNMTDSFALLRSALTGNPAYGVLFAGYLVVVLFLFYRRLSSSPNNNYPAPLNWLTAFSFFALCSTFVAASLITDFPVMPRYLVPVFSWPVIVVGLFLSYSLGRWCFAVNTTFTLAVVLALTVGSYTLAANNGLGGRFYTSDLSCIDDALEKEGLRTGNGIAQYWDAKYLQQFSRLDLRMAQHLENLERMNWITSKTYFRDSYDFAVVDEDAEPAYKISAEALSRINGAPATVVSCGTRSLYIYGKDRMRTQ